jgi:hypothetical protein
VLGLIDVRRALVVVLSVVLSLVCLLAGRALNAAAREARYQVIVHPENPVPELSRAFLRDVFLKRNTKWAHGPAMRPADLGGAAPVREAFTREVLNRSVPEVKRYWQQQIFSGKGVPPPELTSEAEVVAYVLKHPGGIGYLAAHADPKGARVVTVR